MFMDSATHKMHKYNPKIHHRRSTRLRGYDHLEVGMYIEFAQSEKIKSIDFRIWQRNYHDHIIRHGKAFQRISRYIKNNPVNWQKDNKNKN
jgi:hypothetical protein